MVAKAKPKEKHWWRQKKTKNNVKEAFKKRFACQKNVQKAFENSDKKTFFLDRKKTKKKRSQSFVFH